MSNNQNGEMHSMRELTKIEFEELRAVELQMLDVFLDVCEKEKLRYFLVGGCAIGAIRHHGFIPWDDDIDIAMPRPDYMRLIEIGKRCFPNYLFVQNHDTDEQYCQEFAKIRNSNTTFVECDTKDARINHGVYIDIFPIDGFPDNIFSQKILYYQSKIVKAALCKGEYSFSGSIRDFIIACIARIYRNISSKEILDKFEKRVMKYDYDRTRNSICYFGFYGKKEITPVCVYGNGTIADFEGRNVKIPEDYHSYLVQKYGDYMKLPPKDKQISHHPIEVFDMRKSYIEYEGK